MNDYRMTKFELRATWGLGAVFFLRMLGIFMIIPTLTTYGMSLQGANKTLIGLAIGIYGFTQAIFQIPFGMISDKIGRKPIIISGLFMFILGSIIAFYSKSIWGIIISRALQGSGAIAGAMMALLSDLTREQNRSKAMAFIGINFGVTFAIAMVIGPIIANIFGIHILFLIIAILASIGIILILWVVPDNNNRLTDYKSKIIKNHFRIVLTKLQLLKINFGIMCLHILLISTFIVLPEQLETVGFPASEHWKIYLVTMFVSLISVMPFIIYAENKHCMKQVFLLCIILLLIAEISLWGISKANFFKLVTGTQLFFIAFNIMEALLPSLVSKESPTGCKGTAMGVYSTSQFFGVAIGGLLSGWINDLFGPQVIFIVSILLITIWFVVTSTMKESSYISNLKIKIPKEIEINDVLKQKLEIKSGVNEVLIIPQERIAYIKIDNKITNRFEIEQELKT